MGEILSQLGHLFVQSTPTVLFVFLLLIILERLLFRPVVQVLKKREEATSGALARARAQAEEVEAQARQYEAAFQAARQEVYREREEARRRNLSERESMLKDSRAQADSKIKEAQANLAAEVAKAKQEMKDACRLLAQEIVGVVLGTGVAVNEAGEAER
jgi:F-type H+-transporting ATPase subunit b